MNIKIGSRDAKLQLPLLLRQVKSGKSFTITYQGVAIADLIPSANAKAKNNIAAVEKLKAFMHANPVRGVNIKALIEEGRKEGGRKENSVHARDITQFKNST